MSHTQTHQSLQQDNAAVQLVEAQTVHLDVATCAVLPNLTLEGDAATWQADRGIWQIDFGMPDTSVGSGFNTTLQQLACQSASFVLEQVSSLPLWVEVCMLLCSLLL